MDRTSTGQVSMPELPPWTYQLLAPLAVLLLGSVSRGREISPLTRPLIDADGRWLVILVVALCGAAIVPIVIRQSRASANRSVTLALTIAGGSLLVFTVAGWRAVLLVGAVALLVVAGTGMLTHISMSRTKGPTLAWTMMATSMLVTLLPLIALARFRFSPFPFATVAALLAFAGIAVSLTLVNWIGRDVIIASGLVAGLLLAEIAWVASHIHLGYIQFGLTLALSCGAIAALVAARAQPRPSFRTGLEPALIAGAAALIITIDPI